MLYELNEITHYNSYLLTSIYVSCGRVAAAVASKITEIDC